MISKFDVDARAQFVQTWPHVVTVCTLDPESSDRGSNPRQAFVCCMRVSEEGFESLGNG